MHITALEEYGLRCALHLARRHEEGPIAASQISEAEGISIEYVSKLMHLFRKSELVGASRGVQGGFKLNADPASINLKRVLDSLGSKKNVDDDFCNHFSGGRSECAHIQDCSIRPVWSVLVSYFDGVLKELSLADLIAAESTTQKRVSEVALKGANQVKNAILRRKEEAV